MKVIGAGLPRTATTTQMVAFEQLGFPHCYHMRDVLADLESQLPLWESVAEGNPDWERIFTGCESTVDFPSGRYYRELMDYYPDAKIVLSVRDGAGWVGSMRETVWGVYFGGSVMNHVNLARAQVDPLWTRFITLMNHICWNEDTGALAGDHHSDEGFAAIMERYNDEVKATVPAERLLAWHPKDGWAPLCEFLEVETPSEPVPNLNDTAAFREGITGGAIAAINAWWDQRERPSTGLHGAPLE
jgi:hypothetical protein